MAVTATVTIQASPETVWSIVTDFDNISTNITAITGATVLERPDEGILGLKWQETRVMFGKEATETMWVSAVQENRWYETTAHNCGSVYNSRIELEPLDEGTKLSMSFNATPETVMAKLFSVIGFMFNGAIKKAFQQDLNDIKSLAEKK